MTRFRSSVSGARPALLAITLCLGSSVWALPAAARSGGIAASGCTGCHDGGPPGTMAMTSTPAIIQPGDKVEVTLRLMGGFADGGVYLSANGVGQIQTVADGGLKTVADGLVHSQPRAGNGGTVQFRFGWTAPATKGAVRFAVFALGGNGNGQRSGDSPLEGNFDFVYGCESKQYYVDGDMDGVGRADFGMLGCADAPPPNSATIGGDCDDYRKTTYPNATELCNMVDDDCDGEVDEGSVPVELWPDGDSDGYYDARTEKVGTPKMGCAGLKGWAAVPGDCQPRNQDVHPDAEEVCNGADDDCDGDTDERVRPTCGEGWCRREAPGCDVAYCVPGTPEVERCNFLDDDCDGQVDEGDLCPQGESCAMGECVDSKTVVIGTDGVPTVPSSGGGATAGAPTGTPATPGAGANAAPGSGSQAAGCALGARASHGGLATLVMMMAAAGLRRRRRRA